MNMQRFKNVIRAVETTAQLIDLARSTQHHRFNAPPHTTVYLHAVDAEVFIARHDQPVVEIITKLGAPFAWRIGSEQDDAGIYFVVQRKPVVGQVVGALANAVLLVTIPLEAHLILRLDGVRLTLQALTGDFEFSPLKTTDPLLPAAVPSKAVRRG
ncbi:MAG: hypothetical protein SF162_08650 [bacterium]|nr:hypothetical protein [bacterium]